MASRKVDNDHLSFTYVSEFLVLIDKTLSTFPACGGTVLCLANCIDSKARTAACRLPRRSKEPGMEQQLLRAWEAELEGPKLGAGLGYTVRTCFCFKTVSVTAKHWSPGHLRGRAG